jgi:hypothetical protein
VSDTVLVKRDDNRAEQWDRAALQEYLGSTEGRVVKRTQHDDGTVTEITQYDVPWTTMTGVERWTSVLVTERSQR